MNYVPEPKHFHPIISTTVVSFYFYILDKLEKERKYKSLVSECRNEWIIHE